MRMRTGLERVARGDVDPLRGRRVGLIANPTAVDAELRHAADLLPGLAALFGPEHGLRGAAEAGAFVKDSEDPLSGVPVYSLYGAVRRPTPEMLRGVEVLVYDLQDVGARPYTYLSTLRGALEAAAEAKIELWVLDRPDPLGGEVLDGPILESGAESFVGAHLLPLRYAMTPGELAGMLNAERKIGASLKVVPLTGWRRDMSFRATGLWWVAPSPNIPTPETCLVYPGFVLLEGTNLSEGRGTTRPFQLFGAPWLNARELAADLNGAGLPGALFRATEFVPNASKFVGLACRAVEVHVTDPKAFRACAAATAAIATVLKRHPLEFRFQNETFDRLAGGPGLRNALLAGEPLEKIQAAWASGHQEFAQRRKTFLLYRE